MDSTNSQDVTNIFISPHWNGSMQHNGIQLLTSAANSIPEMSKSMQAISSSYSQSESKFEENEHYPMIGSAYPLITDSHHLKPYVSQLTPYMQNHPLSHMMTLPNRQNGLAEQTAIFGMPPMPPCPIHTTFSSTFDTLSPLNPHFDPNLFKNDSKQTLYPKTSSTQSFEKKPDPRTKRLEKNRQSAKESRKRKKEHVIHLQEKLARLERENKELNAQILDLDNERSTQKENEKMEERKVVEKIRKILRDGANERTIHQLIEEYYDKFSDFGSRKRSVTEYHVQRLFQLLEPLEQLKMVLWGLEQEEEYYVDLKQESNCANSAETSSSAPEKHENYLDVIKGLKKDFNPPPLPPEKTMWHYVEEELCFTKEQREEIILHRDQIKERFEELKKSYIDLEKFHSALRDKQQQTEDMARGLEGILSRRQVAQFITWVDKNSICMTMLNQLWPKMSEIDEFTSSPSQDK